MRSALLAVLLLTGCALMPPVAPDLQLREVQLVRSGLLTQRWELQLAVVNHNWRTLTLRDLEYTLFLEGQPLLTHPHEQPLTLPPRSETTIQVPLNSFLGTTLQRRRLSGHRPGQAVHYRVAGSARWGNPARKRRVHSEGRIHLPLYP